MTNKSTYAPPARTASVHPENLKQALHLAGRGFRVFPLLAGMKRPAFAGWQAAASTDPAVVRAWFEGKYAEANVGIATGGGLLVIDADGAVGKSSLEVIESVIGVDLGLVVDTPSGGRHAYLTIPDGQWVPNGVKSLKDYPGIDIRADGGLVVAPGSVVNGTPYTTVNDGDLPLAPQWLVDTIVAGKKLREKSGSEPVGELDTEPNIARAIEYLRGAAPGAIAFAAGDLTTYKVAASIKDFGISEFACSDLMLEHWNETKAEPPWDADKLMSIVANAYAYGTSRPGVKDAMAEFDAVEIDEPANDNRAPLVFTRPVEFGDLLPPPREFLVAGMVPLHKTTLLTGDGGVGKTLAAQQLATAVCSNRLWFGREVKPGPVLCVFSEDDRDEIWRRQIDINRSMDIGMAELGGMNLWTAEDIPPGGCVMMSFPRDNPEGKLMPFYERLRAAVALLRPALVIVDPIANMFGGNELSRTEVTGFMNRTLNRMCLEYRTTVVALAHPSVAGIAENSGRSGSTGWANASRSRLFMSRPKEDPVGDYRTIRTTKANYGKMGTELKVRWDRGAFIATDGDDPEMATDRALLAALRVLAERGEWFSPKKTAGNFPLTLVRAAPEVRGYDRDSLAASYERLLRSGAIALSVGTRRNQGHPYDEIVIREAPVQEADDVFGV